MGTKFILLFLGFPFVYFVPLVFKLFTSGSENLFSIYLHQEDKR